VSKQSFVVGRDGYLAGVDLFVDFQRVSNANPVSVAIVDGTGRAVVRNDGARMVRQSMEAYADLFGPPSR
jgi:RNase P protein component